MCNIVGGQQQPFNPRKAGETLKHFKTAEMYLRKVTFHPSCSTPPRNRPENQGSRRAQADRSGSHPATRPIEYSRTHAQLKNGMEVFLPSKLMMVGMASQFVGYGYSLA